MLSGFFGLVVVALFLCIDTYVHILVTNPEMEVSVSPYPLHSFSQCFCEHLTACLGPGQLGRRTCITTMYVLTYKTVQNVYVRWFC